MRSFARPFAATVCVVACSASLESLAIADTPIAGTRPAYSDRVLSQPPNAASIRARMWVPEIDLGFVPQGLTVAGDSVLLAAYNSEGGPAKCRIFRINRRTLAVTGSFDLPSICTHAGGLAYAGGKRLFVADTSRLFEIDLERAFDATRAGDAVVRTWSLRFPLRGSFIAYRDAALWIGQYKKPQTGRLYRLPLEVIDAIQEPPGLAEDDAKVSLVVAPKSQGGSFDKEGYLWLSQSNSQAGALQKVDPKTGAVLATYEMMAGIEDLGFDADGMLWSVGEAGSKRWHNWPTYYPILFSIDVRALK